MQKTNKQTEKFHAYKNCNLNLVHFITSSILFTRKVLQVFSEFLCLFKKLIFVCKQWKNKNFFKNHLIFFNKFILILEGERDFILVLEESFYLFIYFYKLNKISMNSFIPFIY